jgi:O-antigen ligase
MARFTSRTSETNLPPGSTYHFHSQWLQVGVEWGLVVLMVLTAAMLAIFRRCFVEYRRARLVLPLSALAAYCGLLLVSICFDSISGSLLGLGLLTSGIVQPSGLLLHHPH